MSEGIGGPLQYQLQMLAAEVDVVNATWRSLRIMDFLNDGRLGGSYQAGHVVDFVVMDVANRRPRDDPEFNRFIAWPRVLLFRTLSILYIGLAALSVTIAIFFHGHGRP